MSNYMSRAEIEEISEGLIKLYAQNTEIKLFSTLTLNTSLQSFCR